MKLYPNGYSIMQAEWIRIIIWNNSLLIGFIEKRVKWITSYFEKLVGWTEFYFFKSYVFQNIKAIFSFLNGSEVYFW